MHDLELIRSGAELGRVRRSDLLRLLAELERLRGVAANAEEDRKLAAAAMAEAARLPRVIDVPTRRLVDELRRRGWSAWKPGGSAAWTTR